MPFFHAFTAMCAAAAAAAAAPSLVEDGRDAERGRDGDALVVLVERLLVVAEREKRLLDHKKTNSISLTKLHLVD